MKIARIQKGVGWNLSLPKPIFFKVAAMTFWGVEKKRVGRTSRPHNCLNLNPTVCPPTLQETNISPQNGILKMIFLFPRWDMLVPWRVSTKTNQKNVGSDSMIPGQGSQQSRCTITHFTGEFKGGLETTHWR